MKLRSRRKSENPTATYKSAHGCTATKRRHLSAPMGKSPFCGRWRPRNLTSLPYPPPMRAQAGKPGWISTHEPVLLDLEKPAAPFAAAAGDGVQETLAFNRVGSVRRGREVRLSTRWAEGWGRQALKLPRKTINCAVPRQRLGRRSPHPQRQRQPEDHRAAGSAFLVRGDMAHLHISWSGTYHPRVVGVRALPVDAPG